MSRSLGSCHRAVNIVCGPFAYIVVNDCHRAARLRVRPAERSDVLVANGVPCPSASADRLEGGALGQAAPMLR